LYSLHAPEVECISKGKAHKKYEFGVKVSVAATTSSWGCLLNTAPPYDDHTLTRAIEQVYRSHRATLFC
jgi:IS5 family transposase